MNKLIWLILLLHLFILSKLTFTAWPEMLSYPFLISHQFNFYKDFILPYPPLLVLLLTGVFKIFGFNVLTLKFLTWILILSGDLILYQLLNLSNKIRLILLTLYVILQSVLDGNQLWFDFSMVLPLLLSFYCLSKKKFFLSGIFLGFALLIKQTAVVYCLLLAGLLLFQNRTKVINLVSGILLINLPLVIYLLISGSLREFWLWSIWYPLFEWNKFPGYVALVFDRSDILTLLLLFLPVGGMLLIKDFKKLSFGLVFLISAGLAIYPRVSHFHLQPLIPFLIILYGLIYSQINLKSYLFLIVICILLVTYLNYRSVLGDQIRFYSDRDQNLINQMDSLSESKDKVFLLGFNSANYVYANRIPPKNWSDNFGWYLEIPGVQSWVIEGLIKESPKVIFVKTPDPGNWYDLGTYQPQEILRYIQSNYKLSQKEGNIEIWLKN